MRFSEEVFAALDKTRPGFVQVSTKLVHHPAFPAVVVDWFVILFHVIRTTTPLLLRAKDATEVSTEFGRKLHAYYGAKLHDEAGHDAMLVTDLARLGKKPHELKEALPPPSVTALVGSQFYLVDFVHPAAYLGYIALLEGYPLEVAQVEWLAERSRTPRAAWSTMRMHAAVDGHHREDLCAVLDEVPEDGPRAAIIQNALRSAEFQRCAIASLLATADRMSTRMEAAI